MTGLVWWPYRMIQEPRTISLFLLQGVHLKVTSQSRGAVGVPSVIAASQVSGQRMGEMSKEIKFLAGSVSFFLEAPHTSANHCISLMDTCN